MRFSILNSLQPYRSGPSGPIIPYNTRHLRTLRSLLSAMNQEDFALIDKLPNVFIELAGHAHRARFDDKSADTVKNSAALLSRAFSLLGSGLLAADSPGSVDSVYVVLRQLVESDAASACFPWADVPAEHLVSCSLHFVRVALLPLERHQVPDTAAVCVAVSLLEKSNPLSRISDEPASLFLYLAYLLRHLPNENSILVRRIENGVATHTENSGVSVLCDLWRRGPLFEVARSHVLKAVDSGPESNSAYMGALINAARELACMHSCETPGHATALALIMCSSIHASHRTAGVRIVWSLAQTGDASLWEACIESLRDAVVLPQVTISALHCLREITARLLQPSSTFSLAHPDERRATAADLALDAISRFLDHSHRGSVPFHVARALADIVYITDSALLSRLSTFVDLFSVLLVRAFAYGTTTEDNDLNDNIFYGLEVEDLTLKESNGTGDIVLDVLVSAFERASEVVWSRLHSQRKRLLEGCISAAAHCDGCTPNAHLVKVMGIVLRCDYEEESRKVMEALLRNSEGRKGLSGLTCALKHVLEDEEERKERGGSHNRTGTLVHCYFNN